MPLAYCDNDDAMIHDRANLIVGAVAARNPGWGRRAAASPSGPVPALFVLSVLLYVERATFPRMVKEEELAGVASSAQAGAIMSSFYVGYATTQLPGGWLATRHGGEPVLRECTLAGGLLTCAQRVVQPSSPVAVGLLRVGIGCSQGLSFPAIHAVLASSVGARQRPTSVTTVTSGMYFGTALAEIMPCSARTALAAVGVAVLAWTAASNAAAGAGENESLSPRVAKPELRRGGTRAVGFAQLLGCSAVWAVLTASFAFHWLFYSLLSWLPFIYASHSVSSHALRAAPFLSMFGATLLSGPLANLLAGLLAGSYSRAAGFCSRPSRARFSRECSRPSPPSASYRSPSAAAAWPAAVSASTTWTSAPLTLV